MEASQRERLTASRLEAAKVLGCEKVVWEYETGAFLEWQAALVRRMAQFLCEVNPTLIFIHWPADTHFDHQAVAQVSLRVLRSAASLADDDSFVPAWREVWAYSAGIIQTIDFLPDALVLGDETLMRAAENAMEAFSYEKEKKDIWFREVTDKANYWGSGFGLPAEPLKYVGPSFPVAGTLLKQVLGDRLVPAQMERWLRGGTTR